MTIADLPSGHIVTADEYNLLVDGLNLVTNPPIAKLRQTIAQTFATGSGAAITFTTEDIDTANGHSTGSNTSRYTPTVAGWYEVSGAIGWASNTSGARFAYWAFNGTAVDGSLSMAGGIPSGVFRMAAPTMMFLFNGSTDYVELFGLQSSGGNLNTDVTTGALGGQSRMSARRVSAS